jgi:hypothetical protein
MPCGLHYQELFERGWTAERINEAVAAMELIAEFSAGHRSD